MFDTNAFFDEISARHTVYEVYGDMYSENPGMHIMQNTRDTESGRISTLGEVFLEWYLFDSNTQKDIKTFLESENLTDVFTEKQFMDLMCNKAYLDDLLVQFVFLKLPFRLTLDRLHFLNLTVQYNNATQITAPKTLHAQIKQLIQIKKQQTAERTKQYYQEHREEFNQKRRERYLNNPEFYLERNRKWRIAHPEKYKDQQARYHETHADELREYFQQYRTENAELVSKRKKKCYQAKKAQYNQRNKENYEKNKERYLAHNKQYREQLKQKAESAKKICAAYVFLTTLKKTNLTHYLELYTYQQNPLTGMLKTCPALQSMDINMCPLCNSDCGNDICKCCNQKVLSLPNSTEELKTIATELTQKQQIRNEKIAQKKAYYTTHKQQIAARGKEYRETHKEELRTKKHLYQITHKKEIAERRKKQRAEHIEESREQSRKWSREHPEYYRQRAQKPERKQYMKEYHRRYAEQNRKAVQKQKRAWYTANKEKCAAQQKEYYEQLKQKAESAKKICAAYVFLLALRKNNKQEFLKIYTAQANPLIGMLKLCPALQSMDINMCPLCNSDCGNDICTCCNQKVLSLSNALAELQIIATELKQKSI